LKTIIRMLSAAAGIIAIEGTLQLIALGAYLNLTLNLDIEKMKTIGQYGLPIFCVCLSVFAVSIPFSGVWFMKFLIRRERGESFSDDELLQIQRKLVHFPYRVAALSLFNYSFTTSIIVILVVRMFDWGAMAIFLGSAGGIIGGLLTMPFSYYGAGIISYTALDYTSELSPRIPRGGHIGINMPLSHKISLSFVILVVAFIVYVGLAGYAQTIRPESAEVPGGLLLNFALLSLSLLGLTIMLALLVARDITNKLERFKNTVSQIAEGDLAERAKVITNDEIGALAGTVNIMTEQLEHNQHVMEELQLELDESAGELLGATRKILTIAQEQSAGATEQSTAINQVASTHDMILGTARQVAKSAGDSDEMASKILSATKEGNEYSVRTVEGIETISMQVSEIEKAMIAVGDCAERVGNALKVIDEIAERTNLLSLNAALEAAGAGSEGQRFTVVAEQIRRLAEKSRSSSKSIEFLMEEISSATAHAAEITQKGKKSVTMGVELVRGISAKLDNINLMVNSSSELAQSIDLASQQQRTSLEQTSVTINDLVQNTKHTLEGARNTESELNGLERLAERIRSMISKHENMSGAVQEIA